MVSYMYGAPAVDGFANPHFRSLVEDEEVGARFVRRRLGVDDSLDNDGFLACIVAVVQRTCAPEGDHGAQQGSPADVESRFTQDHLPSEGEDKRADEGEKEEAYG